MFLFWNLVWVSVSFIWISAFLGLKIDSKRSWVWEQGEIWVKILALGRELPYPIGLPEKIENHFNTDIEVLEHGKVGIEVLHYPTSFIDRYFTVALCIYERDLAFPASRYSQNIHLITLGSTRVCSWTQLRPLHFTKDNKRLRATTAHWGDAASTCFTERYGRSRLKHPSSSQTNHLAASPTVT